MMNTKYNFQDRVAFITGAASGIGQATAYAFANNGASVAVVDYDSDRGNMTVSTIKQSGGNAFFLECDMANPLQIKNAVEETVLRFGRIDFAFNNAGIEGILANTANCTEENWDRVMSINLKGVWLCMKYQLPQMLEQGFGSIVNCSSVAGLVGFAQLPAYVASKHGVNGLTKTAALEYATSNIRVNSVCPGVIDTAMVQRITHDNKQVQEQLAQGEPVHRFGRAEEVASAVLWLSSNDSSFVTGQNIAVDGGWVAQ